jgi:hypothetical protein
MALLESATSFHPLTDRHRPPVTVRFVLGDMN